MNRNSIKVIKRSDEPSPVKVIEDNAKTESKIELQIVNSVKNWVIESVENKRIEKIFSESKILAWSVVPKSPLVIIR